MFIYLAGDNNALIKKIVISNNHFTIYIDEKNTRLLQTALTAAEIEFGCMRESLEHPFYHHPQDFISGRLDEEPHTHFNFPSTDRFTILRTFFENISPKIMSEAERKNCLDQFSQYTQKQELHQQVEKLSEETELLLSQYYALIYDYMHRDSWISEDIERNKQRGGFKESELRVIEFCELCSDLRYGLLYLLDEVTDQKMYEEVLAKTWACLKCIYRNPAYLEQSYIKVSLSDFERFIQDKKMSMQKKSETLFFTSIAVKKIPISTNIVEEVQREIDLLQIVRSPSLK